MPDWLIPIASAVAVVAVLAAALATLVIPFLAGLLDRRPRP